MFTISRVEILDQFAKKLTSVGPVRDRLLAEKGNAVLDAHKRAFDNALEVLKGVEAEALFMRDHLAAQDRWELSAQQILEVRRSLEPIDLDLEKLKYALNPDTELKTAVHNFNGRRPRW